MAWEDETASVGCCVQQLSFNRLGDDVAKSWCRHVFELAVRYLAHELGELTGCELGVKVWR